MDIENLADRAADKALVLARAKKLTRRQLRELIAASLILVRNDTVAEIARALELEPGRVRKRVTAVIFGEALRIRERLEGMRIKV